jgi:hypothetical protein
MEGGWAKSESEWASVTFVKLVVVAADEQVCMHECLKHLKLKNRWHRRGKSAHRRDAKTTGTRKMHIFGLKTNSHVTKHLQPFIFGILLSPSSISNTG